MFKLQLLLTGALLSWGSTVVAQSDSTDTLPDPPLTTTQHSTSIGGQTINYTATTGYLILREEEGRSPGEGVLCGLH